MAIYVSIRKENRFMVSWYKLLLKSSGLVVEAEMACLVFLLFSSRDSK